MNFKKFFENLNPELHSGTGFDGIRQLARFLQHFEIFTQNHGFSRILLMRQKYFYPFLTYQYDTLAPFLYIYIGHTPNSSGAWNFLKAKW